MEFKSTDEELKLLTEKFKRDLISVLRHSGHASSGKLENSIKFSVVKEHNGFTLQFSSLNYIKYLDRGDLLSEFMKDKQKELKKILTKSIKKDFSTYLLKI